MNEAIVNEQTLHDWARELAAGELPVGWQMVASSKAARVANHADLRLFYKEFLPRGPLESVKATLRGSRARRARENSDALREAGFSAPLNIAWGKLPGGREYLYTSAASGSGVTHWLVKELAERRGETLRLRWQLVAQLGAFIGRFHAAGFIHGDLRSSNVLAVLENGQFQFSLIDNERNVRRQRPSKKLMLRNLMQLNMHYPDQITRGERVRFFRNWLAQMTDLSPEEGRQLALDAYRWANDRLAAKKRK